MNNVDLSKDTLSLGSFGGSIFVVSGLLGLGGLGAAFALGWSDNRNRSSFSVF